MGMQVGRYETLREIASGGMATVHLARALGAGGFERLFAVKTMHAHIAKDPEAVSMFLDEARLAARIRHPNVVATIDVLEAESGLAIVMEYIEGPSLTMMSKALSKKERTLPVDISLRIQLDALAGLDAAHDLTDVDEQPLNLVHRDVSPQNLLVGVDGITRITDFGVARAEARLQSTRSSQLKGKLAYMAPEQIGGVPVDRRCDVYAAGVVFWEILTGRRLFRADNEAALVSVVASGAKKSPHELHAGVPLAVDRACMRALSLDPRKRFSTASAFAEAIEEAASSTGLRIASHKVVAKFVKALAAHDRPVGLPEAPSSSPSTDSSPALPRYRSSSQYKPVSSPGIAPAGDLSLATRIETPASDPFGPAPFEPQTGATNIASVVAHSHPSMRGRRVGMGLAVSIAVVAGIALAVLLTPDEPSDASVAAAPGDLTVPSVPGAEVSPSAEAAGTEEAKPGIETAGSSAPSASAAPDVAPSVKAPAAAVPRTRRPSGPRTKTPKKSQPSTVFETTEL